MGIRSKSLSSTSEGAGSGMSEGRANADRQGDEGTSEDADQSVEMLKDLRALYPSVGGLIEQGCFKAALETIFAYIRKANKYFDEQQPWITVNIDIQKCSETLNTCIQIIANLAVLLEPFLPFSSEKVKSMLSIDSTGWHPISIPSGLKLGPVDILFERIDKKVINEELERLHR